ncbi:MAG: NAD(P)H-binding protein [Bifidobacterium aquikefiri]|uniref:NAD(P)-dependent oxidoreductase n=1 Tax=Bifidobacterium aquikefiri TaxID=1653207 RepID=A0A261GBX5_9BIFI|nr:NAD(P)H-binding protein [Bifidobacterium aquikefiri]OZG68743.1 NAD(P)-dependent oxidoreductase [Bifidobacterium aquikefiri]
MRYLVTGASGGFGGYALDWLLKLAPKEDVVGLIRDPGKAGDIEAKGAEARIGDYGDIDSLKRAFESVDRLLFISGVPGNRQQEHANVIDAAEECGISFIAYTSFAHADLVHNMLSEDHVFTEARIVQSGIAHTFLRNNWYLENETTLFKHALKTGQLVYMAGEATVGWALKREYAEAAARVILAGNQPEVMELSADPTRYSELAQALEAATGKAIDAVDMDEAQFIEALRDEVPEQAIQGMIGIQQLIAHGDLEVKSDDFVLALGHSLVGLEDAVKETLGSQHLL